MTVAAAYIRQNNFIEKLVRSKLFWILFTGMMFGVPLYRSVTRELPKPNPVYGTVPDFNLVDENGNKFSKSELKGKTYLASFVFTSCASTCPATLKKLQVIKKRTRQLGHHFMQLTFTVDPEVDTPEVLFKQARDVDANPFKWKFLTGTHSELEKLLIDGFKVPMGDKTPIEGGNLYDVAHSNRVILVDKRHKIRGYYKLDDKSIDQLMIDIGLIVNRP